MHVSNYRSDIDGIRAVAVLLVLMFHLGLGVPGGYIGVDVFFIISGYLLTGIIKREIEQGEFTFVRFYERRARRILPALLAVLLFSSVAAFLILLPSDLERYAKSMAAALFAVSNFWFWSQGGYFGGDSEMAPLLHTWSLGVEEQFYFLLPIALLLLFRWVPAQRWVGRLVLLACVGTFAASAWFVPTRTLEVFYFTPFRTWELLLGSLLSIYSLPAITSNVHRQLLAAIGLLLIVVPAFAYSSQTVFPGPAAALPCIGTALLIWMGTSGESAATGLLKSRVLVFLGLISYSLYLWHWPLLAFARNIEGGGLILEVRLGIGLASLVLAYLSWRFIETPFRSKIRFSARQALLFSISTAMLLGSMAVTVLLSHGLQDRFTPEVAALDRARTRDSQRAECTDQRDRLDDNTVCHIGAASDATVLVWGDSYAHAMLPAFDVAFQHMGVAASFAAHSGCPPLPAARVSFKGQENWRCHEFNDKVVDFLRTHPKLNQVVLAAAWNIYTNETAGFQLRVSGAGNSAASLKQGIEVLMQQLQSNAAVHNFIVVDQIPTYDESVPYKMLLSKLKGKPFSPMRREDWNERTGVTRGIFEDLANPSARIAFIESSEWFCGTGTCRYASDQGQPYYWDGGHINAQGVQLITPLLERALRKLIGNSKVSRSAPSE